VAWETSGARGPPGHALTEKKTVTVDQLAAHALIVREAGSGLRHCFEKSLEGAGRSMAELRVALELGSNEAIKEAVLRGVGLAVLSALAVQKELAAGRLRALDIEGVRCDREMFVVQDRRRVPPLTARLFLNFLDANPLSHLAP
jgi:DNA-binding transcriptional LysR family regulator